MINIVADDKIPFLKGALEPFANMIYADGRSFDRDFLQKTDAILIRTRTRCNQDLLEGTRIRFIGTATIGTDHIDTSWCDQHGVVWRNVPGCNADSVMQYVASALAVMHRHHGFPFRGKTIGIVGVGNVGKRVARLAELLGMKVLLHDPPRARAEGDAGFVPLYALLAQSDIVTLHVPLNPEGIDRTVNLLDDEKFRMMKTGSWLINTSRGEVIGQEALRSAIDQGIFGGVVLDVWNNEPDIDRALLEKVTIATPHIAGYSTDGKMNGTAGVVNAVASYFGFPLQNWQPSEVPPPAQPLIELECRNDFTDLTIGQAILHTYNILDDDLRLRGNPGDFEKFRGNYPVRREFPAYTIRMSDSGKCSRTLLENLGFRVI